MQDIHNDLQGWLAGKKPFALATVTRTWGSAPRQVGAAMAVDAEMAVIGSVSGGCVENAVIEAALSTLQSGTPALLEYGVSDETAWSVGLTCGGKVRIWVAPHMAFSSDAREQRIWAALDRLLSENGGATLLTRLNTAENRHLLILPDGERIGDWGALNESAAGAARQAFDHRQSSEIELGDQPILVQVFAPRERLLVIGAAHIAVPLVKFARDVGFEIIVIDPRKIFAAAHRFPTPPDQLLDQWPAEAMDTISLDSDTYAVLLSHDPKIDDPALHRLLGSPAAYIGALGSRKTHEKRCARLASAGFTEDQIGRIQGPAGLDIGARTPAEIALSIISQIISVKRKRSISGC